MSALEMLAIEGPATTRAVVELLTGSATAPRLAMRGTSMLPLLRERMVLQLGPSGPDDRVADILVFERNGQLVAHRITGKRRDGSIQTCGDARPWSPEYPKRNDIIGKVVAVFADDRQNAARVDNRFFRIRGSFYSRFRAVRAIPFWVGAFGRRLAGGLPWRRERAYGALVAAMSAVVRRDPVTFERSLRAVDFNALLTVARRHRCSALLAQGARDLAPGAEHSLVRQLLQPDGRSVVLRALSIKTQIVSVAELLSQAAIPFALLKGAARLYRDEPDAVLHPSSDIDVLIKAADLDAAVEAFHKAGYLEDVSPQLCDQYRRLHHHAAPLYPSGPGAPIELHTSLAPRRLLSIPLDWEALADHMSSSESPAGRVCVLDDVGAALNLAAHNLRLQSLRDSVLLAQLIQRMSVAERLELKRIISAERTDFVGLQAAVAFATQIAGFGWQMNRQVSDYVGWCIRREDIPLYFAQRSQLMDAWYVAGRRLTRMRWSLVDPRTGSLAPVGSVCAVLRIAGRVLAGVVANAYALVLRRAP